MAGSGGWSLKKRARGVANPRQDPDNASALLERAHSAAQAFRLCPPPRLKRGRAGLQLGQETGSSLDFQDFRAYQPGDDLRRVDWGVYARSDILVVRQYQNEVSPILEILLDPSASMGLYDGKVSCALFLAGFLAALARKDAWQPMLNIGARAPTGDAIENTLATLHFDSPENPPFARQSGPSRTTHPVRFLVSDFLFSVDLDKYLDRIAGSSATLVLLHILAESERNPEFGGATRLVDVEHPATFRDARLTRPMITAYQARLNSHLEAIQAAALRSHAVYVPLHVPDQFTSTDPLEALITSALMRRGIVSPS